MSREQWTAILQQVLAVFSWVAGAFFPEYKEITTWIAVGIEAIGMVLILIFVHETQKVLKELRARVM